MIRWGGANRAAVPEVADAFRCPLRPGAGCRLRLSLSIWQMEVSLTQIFDRPLRGREFFEEILRDNLDLGRPDRVS